MEIIPKSMFFILNDIIELQTNKIKELPTRLVRGYAECSTFCEHSLGDLTLNSNRFVSFRLCFRSSPSHRKKWS